MHRTYRRTKEWCFLQINFETYQRHLVGFVVGKGDNWAWFLDFFQPRLDWNYVTCSVKQTVNFALPL